MTANLHSFLKRFLERRRTEVSPQTLRGNIQSGQPQSGQVIIPPPQSIVTEEMLRLEQELPRLQKIFRLPAAKVARMSVEDLHSLMDYEVEKLKRLNPQAPNILEMARLLAIERYAETTQTENGEPQFEAAPVLKSPEAQTSKPYPERPGDKVFLGENKSSLILVDRPVGAGIEKDTGLLEAIHAVMQVCTVPTEAITENRPASGLLFAYSVAELAYMFSIEGAQVITLDDRRGRVLGIYIYYTAGPENIPADDRVFVQQILSELSAFGTVPLKPALLETVCIDKAVESIADETGHRHHRGEYYRQMLYEGDIEAEATGSDLWIGWCREKPAANLAIKVHQHYGCEPLGALDVHIPALGCQGTYRLLKRRLFAGDPGVRIVPFEDRNPADGYTGIMPKGSSLRFRRLL